MVFNKKGYNCKYICCTICIYVSWSSFFGSSFLTFSFEVFSHFIDKVVDHVFFYSFAPYPFFYILLMNFSTKEFIFFVCPFYLFQGLNNFTSWSWLAKTLVISNIFILTIFSSSSSLGGFSSFSLHLFMWTFYGCICKSVSVSMSVCMCVCVKSSPATVNTITAHKHWLNATTVWNAAARF